MITKLGLSDKIFLYQICAVSFVLCTRETRLHIYFLKRYNSGNARLFSAAVFNCAVRIILLFHNILKATICNKFLL